MGLAIRIEYCSAWNYEPHAVGLAEKLMRLKQSLDSVTLVPGGGGVFEVSVNGIKIYSKKETGQFPDPDAILKKVREHK
jgi:selenoprotein W-related protein